MDPYFKQVQLKDTTIQDSGQVRAVFATLNIIDKQGDIIVNGAIQNGQSVRMSAYNHSSWGGSKPVGRGVITEVGNELVFDGQFFLDTIDGLDTYKVVKNLSDLGEWSFGFNILEKMYTTDEATGNEIRKLMKLDVFEVSPVLLGAGQNTRTTSIKGAENHEEKQAIPSHKTDTTDAAWNGPANEKKLKLDQNYAFYRNFYAWVDPEGDRTKKSAYKFGHHMVDGSGDPGAANIKACQTGIGILNGGRGGTTIPSADREGVWRHLAKHLRDAGLEPPALKSYDGGKSITYADHAGWVYGDVIDFVERSQGIAAVNEEKGKEAVSDQNRESLKSIADGLRQAADALSDLVESKAETDAEVGGIVHDYLSKQQTIREALYGK